MIRLPLAFLKRDFFIAVSYRTAFALQVLYILASVPVFYFFGKLFASSDSSFLDRYDGNYFAFLLIGIAFLDYLSVSLRTFNQSMRDSQLMGTLEIVLLSPTSLTKVLIYSSLYVYVQTTVRFILYILVGLLFGLDIQGANIPAAMLILLLSILSFASFGMISASLIVVIKRGEMLNILLSIASLILGGVMYPIELMPEFMQVLSKLIPITHGLEGMRLALLTGASTASLIPQLLILLLFAAVLLPLALTSFYLAVQYTKMTGTLAQY